MARVKGTAVQSSLRYVRERFGEAGITRVLADLPDADREALAHGVLPSSWYPMQTLLRFMRHTALVFGPQEPDVIRRMGRASCDYGVTGVYKIFFKVGSPEFIISRAAPAFSSYYDSGELRIVEKGPRSVAAELAGLDGGAPEFCERIYGWMERTLELAGAKHLRSSHSACVHRGDRVCRFEGTWE